MRLAVGIGLNSKAEAPEIVALIGEALELAGLALADVVLLASAERKAASPSLAAAAAHFGVPLELLPDDALAAVAPPNPSALAEARTGLPSVAEAAALCFGRLVVAKQRSSNATCAIAEIAP